MRLSSGLHGAPNSDLYLNIQSKTSWNAMGLRLASLNAVLLKPRGTGQVRLQSPDAERAPLVEFGYGDHAGDVESLSMGLLEIVRLVHSPEVRPLIGRPFVVRVGDRIRKWNAHTRTNELQALAFAALLDLIPARLADSLLARMTGEPVDLRSMARAQDALHDFVRREVSGVYHPVGTCRMGQAGDPCAVVTPDGRVIGVEGLRVADASVMPSVPRGNTNIPTIMVAEKLADHILRSSPGTATSQGSTQWTSNSAASMS
jgi:5-(hydroxymethyl)furfural/furfural oxidase